MKVAYRKRRKRIGTLSNGHPVFWCTAHSNLFPAIVDVRRRLFGPDSPAVLDATDAYSDHYVAMTGTTIEYALRVTRASRGPIECEEYYPCRLIEERRDQIGSAGRLLRSPGVRGSRALSTEFMRLTCADQVERGSRLDLINATERLLGYYERLGYVRLEGAFIHPRLGTESYALALPADPTRETPMRPVFRGVDDPLLLSDLMGANR